MFKKTLCCALLFAAFGSVQAKGYSPAVTARAGGYDVKFAQNGTPIAVPVSTLPDGRIGAVSSFNVPLPGGIMLPVAASAAIAAGALFTPWGAAISIAVTAGSIGVAALDAALDAAKIRVRPGGVLERQTTSNVYAVACQAGNIQGSPSYLGQTCGDALALYYRQNGMTSCTYKVSYFGAKMQNFNLGYNGVDCGGAHPSFYPDLISTSLVPEVITAAEAAQVMSVRSPSVAEVQALVDMNLPVVLEPPFLTGSPAVYKGNTVMLGIDGTTTEIEERYIASFKPGIIGIGVETTQKVTTPQKQSTTTTTNADGSTSTAVTITPSVTKSITSSTAVPQEATDTPPVDSALPDQMKLYEPKYPDGLVGVWAVNKASLVATPLANLIGSLMPSVGTGGNCPTMNVNLNYSSWANFGTHDFAPPCAIWEFGKWVIIFSALLLARSLVFGG